MSQQHLSYLGELPVYCTIEGSVAVFGPIVDVYSSFNQKLDCLLSSALPFGGRDEFFVGVVAVSDVQGLHEQGDAVVVDHEVDLVGLVELHEHINLSLVQHLESLFVHFGGVIVWVHVVLVAFNCLAVLALQELHSINYYKPTFLAFKQFVQSLQPFF